MTPRYTQKQKNILKEVEHYVRRMLPTENVDIKAHDWKHAFRVRNWALQIGKGENYENTFLLELASLLHDIGRLREKELKRTHAEVSALMVKEYLSSKDWLSDSELKSLIYAIENHSRGGKGELVCILQDADRLDGFGAIGLIRAFQPKWHLPDYDPNSIVNSFTMSPAEITAFFKENPGGELVSYAVDHIAYQATWYDRMNTKTGEKLGKPLATYTKTFLEELKREVQGLTPLETFNGFW